MEFAKLPPEVAYVAQTAFVYSGPSFDQMPECFSGWMDRSDADSGEAFEPSTVAGRADCAIAAGGAMPMLLDVRSREAIWADLSLAKNAGWGMVEAQAKRVAWAARAVALSPRPMLADLVRLHARARGELARERSEADFAFAEDGDLSPFDFARVSGELMANPGPEALAPKAKRGPKG